MTEKDYIAIAAALSATRPTLDNTLREISQWTRTRDALADVLADDNPRFDRDQFEHACGEVAQ